MALAQSSNTTIQLNQIDDLNGVAKTLRNVLRCNTAASPAMTPLATLPTLLQKPAEPPVSDLIRLSNGYIMGRLRATANEAAEMVRSRQKSLFLWALLGRCYLELGAFEKSAICLTRATAVAPQMGELWSLLGEASEKDNKINEAATHYRKAVELAPKHLTARSHLGTLLASLGQFPAADKHLSAAINLEPNDPELHFKRAETLCQLGQLDAAKQAYMSAISIDSDYADAHFGLGQINAEQGNHADAIKNFNDVLENDPNNDAARVLKMNQMAHFNDWSWSAEYQKHRKLLGLHGIGCDPLSLITLEDNPDLLRLRTHAFAAQEFGAITPRPSARVSQRPNRLRIGYFASDIGAQVDQNQLNGLIENHDLNRFEVFVYSYGTSRQADLPVRMSENLARCRNVQGNSNAEIIAIAQADKLDIAVDLSGYTQGNRCAIFASPLASLHMSYLGHPGTMGNTAFDYLIGDHTVCPPGSERFYCEHLIRLPDSFQLNDDQCPISSRQLTRQACGLPDDAFVFCNFGSNHKITPQEFDIWMRLLAQVKGSVLWLMRGCDQSVSNLQHEASERGIDPARLIFADRMPKPEHLARHKIADLFLDTFTCNAHRTGSDALWAGLPVLTLAGQQFAARVGASLLDAVGLTELITQTTADYETCALDLATSPDRLLSLRGKLKTLGQRAPLFDTQKLTRALEQGIDMAFERHIAGQRPTHLTVPEISKAETNLANKIPKSSVA